MTAFVHSKDSLFQSCPVTYMKASSPEDLRDISTTNPNLSVVDLSGVKIDSSGFAELLPLCEKITSLNLSGTNVFDRPQMIGEFQNLTHLDVSFTTLSKGAVQAILGLPHLQSLKVVHTNIRREWLEGMKLPVNLTLRDNLLFV